MKAKIGQNGKPLPQKNQKTTKKEMVKGKTESKKPKIQGQK